MQWPLKCTGQAEMARTVKGCSLGFKEGIRNTHALPSNAHSSSTVLSAKSSWKTTD